MWIKTNFQNLNMKKKEKTVERTIDKDRYPELYKGENNE